MDPFTLAAGAQGIGSVVSSLMNTSSAQAINSAQMAMAQHQFDVTSQGRNLGEYYSNLRRAGEDAGLNPLALIGAHVPGGGGVPSAIDPRPGDAAAGVGKGLSQLALAEHDSKMQQLTEKKLSADIANVEANRVNTMNEAMLKWQTSQRLTESGDKLLPPGLTEGGGFIGRNAEGLFDILRRYPTPSLDAFSNPQLPSWAKTWLAPDPTNPPLSFDSRWDGLFNWK